ncbi:MAG: hypothetical protein SVU32_00670, partial [Candidatus Nanohaloarchaea archaeon]|nr:hypothetical protein [Candidatus Nanohaloarchaea archaeon]
MTVLKKIREWYWSWRDSIDYSEIDPEIQELCACINHHPDMETLSSCQGHYRKDDVKKSTRSSSAGPYIIIGHPEPGEELEKTFEQLEKHVEEVDDDVGGHNGFLVR